MKKKILVIVVLFCFSFSFSQNNYIKHTVVKGETITQIAQKYKVTPYDIYKLNPDSQNGIQLNSVLLIPNNSGAKENTIKSNQVHIVKAKETLYSISKQYGTSIEEIEENNPLLKSNGLQIGQELVINKNQNSPKTAPKKDLVVTHEVQSKETKYSIATKYDITVEELEKQNPEIKESLPIGFILKIKRGNYSNDTKTEPINESKSDISSGLEYIVKKGETLYSISQLTGISQEVLGSLNPNTKEGLIEGMVLKLPKINLMPKVKSTNQYKDLTKSISNQSRKEMVFLLPFNISSIESDTANTFQQRLQKDKFLNMTLDFYSGVLMAIDSANALGLNINVKIFDSKENKFSSTAISTIQNQGLNADVIIGPFYQNNVEKLAEAVEYKNIPVISPLSKDFDKSYKNLYQSTPTNDDLKDAMFDYMHSKNGNIIAVIDPKKASIKQYITQNQTDTKIVGLSEKGGFTADSIKKYFVKDRMNFVVMESEKTNTIFTVTNTMTNAMKDYQVQLVILETNETLDYEEIALSRLTKLKMTYPSLTRSNESSLALKFERVYKKKNKILPNQFAIRGFDLAFDTMLRLSQNESLEESLKNTSTEQVENKFDYISTNSKGYINNGIYILYYDTDLTIKQAK